MHITYRLLSWEYWKFIRS